MISLKDRFIDSTEVFVCRIFLLDLLKTWYRNSHGGQEMFPGTESIRYDIFLTRFKADGKGKLLNISALFGKVSSHFMLCLKVLERFMIGVKHKFSTYQVMPPMAKWLNKSIELQGIRRLLALWMWAFLVVEGNWMSLGKDTSNSNIGHIACNFKHLVKVWKAQDRSFCDFLLDLLKSSSCGIGPSELTL